MAETQTPPEPETMPDSVEVEDTTPEPEPELSFLEQELYDEPATPEPEPEAAKPSTPSYTTQRALGYGVPQDEIDQMTPAALDIMVKQMDALAIRAYKASQSQQSTQQQPEVEQEPDELEGVFDPVLVKHIKGLQAETQALKQELFRTRSEQQQAKATEFRTRFDQNVAEYGIKDDQVKVQLVTMMDGLDQANRRIGKALAEPELIEMAARAMGLEKVRTTKAKEQWKNGGAVRPTNRSSDEPPSDLKARKNLRDRLKALGLESGMDDDEDFFG